MASNAISEITEEFLVCQICFEDFKQPKMLPCLHTFCQPCLERLLTTEPVGKLSCPTCRQDVSLLTNGVQGLKSNFLVGKLHDILQVQPKGKDEAVQSQEDGVLCTVCGKDNPAKFYCVECADYLCLTCNDAHCGLKATRFHRALEINDLQAGRLATELQRRETSKCEDHYELNKFYCDTCYRVICLHCVVMAHKSHQYVEIEKAAERQRSKLMGELVTVKNTANLHEERIEKLRSVKDEWSSQVQRTEEQITMQTNAIIEAAEKVKKDRVSQLRAMDAARQKQLEITMEAAEMDLASAKSCIQFTDNVLEYGSTAEVMSVAGVLVGRLEQTSNEKRAEKVELINGFMDLTVDPPARDVEQEVSKLVGGIKHTIGRRQPVLCAFQSAQAEPTVVIDTPKNMMILGLGYRSHRDGQFNRPTSLAVTAEGDIVVTDRDNKRLQFFDNGGYFKTKVDLTFKPECATVLTNGDMLMTGDGHRIHVLDRRGRETRVITVPGAKEKGETTQGIAADNLGRIIVSIGYQVFVLSPSGDVMLKFGDKGPGYQQLSSSLHVTVNSSNQIIISDFHNHNLKIFDPAGRHLFTCGSEGLGPGKVRSPYCVITDSEDNIIVTVFHGNHVSLFSHDGTFLRHLVTGDQLIYPMGLTLTHDGRMVASDRSSIKIFHVDN